MRGGGLGKGNKGRARRVAGHSTAIQPAWSGNIQNFNFEVQKMSENLLKMFWSFLNRDGWIDEQVS